MMAINRWQDRIIGYRQDNKESVEMTWQRIAGWYDSWVANNNYVELVLPGLLQSLSPNARVLEIGPGTGAFTLPLARHVREVTAVEPSENFRKILSLKLEFEGLDNLKLIPQRIQQAVDSLEGPFDLTLASFSLFNVKSIDRVIEKLIGISQNLVALMGTGESRSWYQGLHRTLKGCDSVSPPQLDLFYPVLLEMGIFADVEVVETSNNYVFGSENELVNHWMERMNLAETNREEMVSLLRPHIEKRNSHVGIFKSSRMASIRIERGKNI
ncbi:MAG: methyltransferase domain-containing protein [Anaerolineales bacterium]|nr:methyltransferase domain-containing protein [Anaerolineales bacterium]